MSVNQQLNAALQSLLTMKTLQTLLSIVTLAAALTMSVSAQAGTYPLPDANGYISQFDQPVILADDDCRDGRVCHSVPVCDVTFSPSTAVSTINSELNGSDADRVFCFEPGDYRSHGTYTITRSGSESDRRWIRAAGDGDLTHPVDRRESELPRMPKIVVDGADYWIFHRLFWDMDNALAVPLISFEPFSGANHNILDRVLIQQIGGRDSRAVIDLRQDNNYNIVQHSVIRDMKPSRGVDTSCVRMYASYFNRVVNNEIYDCTKGIFFFSNPELNSHVEGTVIENNDLYDSPAYHTDCRGNHTDDRCSAGKGPVSGKRGGSADNPVILLHNRFWGGRRADTSICCTAGADGALVSISNDYPRDPSGAGSKYIIYSNNIFFDAQKGVMIPRDGQEYASVVGNLFFNIRDFRPDTATPTGAIAFNYIDRSEVYFNTVVDSDAAFILTATNEYSDIRCNAFINNKDHGIDSVGTGTEIAANAWYGTKAFNTGDGDDVVGAKAVDAGHDAFTFKRKLLTGPETVTVANARPTESSPHYLSCPSDIGSRKGIGIGDGPL